MDNSERQFIEYLKNHFHLYEVQAHAIFDETKTFVKKQMGEQDG